MSKFKILLLFFYLLASSSSAQQLNKNKPAVKKIAVKKLTADWQLRITPSKDSISSRSAYVEVFPHSRDLDFAHFAVVSPQGKRVKAKLLWTAPGEAAKILFDSSGNAKYFSILFGTNIPAQKKKWEPRAGLIMETRKRAKGNAANWKKAKDIIDNSLLLEGRSPVDRIFHGINPHGPSQDIVVHYKGFLKIKKSGKYKFAIAADDAVFLFIDGARIVDWPGLHGPWGGVRGRFSNSIRLKSGIHTLEYFNVQDQYGLNMICAWQPPWRKHLEIIPSKAFVPLEKFVLDKIKFKGKTVSAYFKWERKSHLLVKSKILVNMKFSAINLPKGSECKWFFDDLSTATGASVTHLFLSPGLRKVKMEVRKKGIKLGSVENIVKVAPRWSQREEFPPSVQKSIMKKIRNMDLSKIPPKDLSNLVDFLTIIEKRSLLASIGKVCLKREKEFAGNPQMFYKLAHCFIHYSIRKYNLAEQAYLAAIKFSANNPKLKAQAKLYLGALNIHNFGKCKKGIALIKEINDNNLASFEKRKKSIWLADGYMTMGEIESVDKIYSKLPDVVDKNKKSITILNEARVFNALNYLKNGAADEAEKMVWQVEWEFPYEAMKSHTGLVMTKIFIQRKEYNYALWRCMRMMRAAQNSRQMSDIMLTLIEVYHLTGKQKEAEELTGKLLKEYPYSEAAAILKEKIY